MHGGTLNRTCRQRLQDLTNQVAFIDTRQRVTGFGTSRNHDRLVYLTLQSAVQASCCIESRKPRLAAQIY